MATAGTGEKRAEIYTYEAPWLIYALGWSVSSRRPDARRPFSARFPRIPSNSRPRRSRAKSGLRRGRPHPRMDHLPKPPVRYRRVVRCHGGPLAPSPDRASPQMAGRRRTRPSELTRGGVAESTARVSGFVFLSAKFLPPSCRSASPHATHAPMPPAPATVSLSRRCARTSDSAWRSGRSWRGTETRWTSSPGRRRVGAFPAVPRALFHAPLPVHEDPVHRQGVQQGRSRRHHRKLPPRLEHQGGWRTAQVAAEQQQEQRDLRAAHQLRLERDQHAAHRHVES